VSLFYLCLVDVFGASVGDKFYRNTSGQRWPLYRLFDPLLALSLFSLRHEAKGLKRTPLPAVTPALISQALGPLGDSFGDFA
jgi:hypothetical protein